MTEARPNPAELVGWKAVAAYLRVSVRTAQDFEKTRGLPVRRGAGLKAPVFALIPELDEWKANRLSASLNDGVETLVGADEENNRETPSRDLHRRQWLGYATLAGIGLAGLIVGIRKLHSKSNLPPAGYRVNGNTLTVVAADGSILWQHKFGLPINANTFDGIAHSPKPCIFSDLNGDGHLETLFYYPLDDVKGTLFCFDDSGNVLWEFVPRKTVRSSQGWEYAPPYFVAAFAVMPGAGYAAARVIITSNHHYSYPDYVAVLDGTTGSLVSDYWHRGHLRHIANFDLDLNGARRPAVVLGGVNDAEAYRQATLVVFDHEKLLGGSQDPLGKPYFEKLSPGTEMAEVFFPKTLLSLGYEFNIVSDVRPIGDQLAVEVAEDIVERDPCNLIYEFDHSLRPTNVILSDRLLQAYAALQAPRKESPDAMARRLLSEVKVLRRWRGQR